MNPSAAPFGKQEMSLGIDSLVQTGKGFLKNDPQSGSILKILSDNQFQETIKAGTEKGHVYTILHAAPSNDFTLVESWDEKVIDEEGNQVVQPRKSYKVFQIIEGATPTKPNEPAPVPAPELALASTPGIPTTPVMPTETSTNQETQPASEAAPSNNTWLRSKLGIPITANPVAEKVIDTPSPSEPAPQSLAAKEAPDKATEVIPPKEAAAGPSAPTTSPAPAGKPENIRVKLASTLEKKIAEEPQNLSHVDMMKKRFGNVSTAVPITAPSPTGEAVKINLSTEPALKSAAENALELKKIQFLESAFGAKLEGPLLKEWSVAKTIPAQPFIYPTEYYWGRSSSNQPIERSLEDYPEASKKLREKLVTVVEELKAKNTAVDKMNVGEAVDAGLANNLI